MDSGNGGGRVSFVDFRFVPLIDADDDEDESDQAHEGFDMDMDGSTASG